MIQSSSRDVTCRGLIKLHKAGFTPYMRLPIHDEIVGSLPQGVADLGAKRMAKLMSEQMGEVFIDTDADVYGMSWGHGYGAAA